MIDIRSAYPNTYDRRGLAAITTVVYHHSTGAVPADEDAARRLLDVIYREHTVNRAWPGAGYHFAVSPLGQVYQLNDLEAVSYHVAGHNADTVGVCFLGDYSDSMPSDAALWAAARLHHDLETQAGRTLAIVGHAELAPTSTELCPSRKWADWKPVLIRRIRWAPEVRVLPYLDSLWGVTERLEVGAAEMERHAAAQREEVQRVRDYIVLIKQAVGLE